MGQLCIGGCSRDGRVLTGRRWTPQLDSLPSWSSVERIFVPTISVTLFLFPGSFRVLKVGG